MFVAVHVKMGHITSSFFLIPANMYARCNASVPDPTATEDWLSANLLENMT